MDRKLRWHTAQKPEQRKLALAAVQPEPVRPEGAVTWNERLAERERRLSQAHTPPRGWPPAAA